LVEVEALRYLHLGELKNLSDTPPVTPEEGIRVLVLGDYVPSNTQRQMNLLEKAASLLPAATEFTVKPHPACPILPRDYPGLSMTVTMEPIAKLLADCDVAYSSAVTSAAVDAYCSGVPTVSVVDPDSLNLSPLRGYREALFVSTPGELATALISIAAVPQSATDRPKIFTVDSRLPRWRNLLDLSEDKRTH
jgi:surface carbohydrate biosynthesis protein (TIGR04326 family)